MKKRDKYWLYRMLVFLAIILFFVGISLYNIVQFNHSYIEEEKDEIEIFAKQIEWAIRPHLENNDINAIKKYCLDFQNDDLAFRIFDDKKHLIAGSKVYDNPQMLSGDSRILHKKYGKWKLYRYSIKDKMLESIKEIKIGNSRYYIELTISEENVIKSILTAQKNILIFCFVGIAILILCLFHVFYTLRNCFNNLEDSVIEIANGNLDYPISVSKNELLKELTISIKILTRRLKTQIARLTQLEQYKSEFLQNITHEIKTPITAINSAIELLKNNNSITKNDKECFDIIQFQVKSINKLVNDILCLSEIESEKTNERKVFKKFNINTLIEETINFLGYSNINFKASSIFEIEGNRELLSTAISNLLINAIKYSHSDKIDVILTQKDNKIILKVKDYGIGIAHQHLNNIFKRFYRVDKARSRETGGTGLGLSIVKNIIELHNGIIYVESELNVGTTFTIELTKY